MSLLLLLAAGAAGAAAAAWGTVRGGAWARAGAVAGVTALIVVLVVALVMNAPTIAGSGAVGDTGGTGLFGDGLVPTRYLRLVVALWAFDAALVVVIGWLLGGLVTLRGLLPATLAAIVGGTVALGSTDLVLGALASAGTGLAGLVAVLAVGRGVAIPTAARELRASLLAGMLLLVAIAVAPVAAALALGAGAGSIEGAGSPPAATDESGAVVGLASLAVVLGVAVRGGAIPFHLRIPRLADVAPPIVTPLLIAWIPLPLAIVGLAAVDRLVAPLALPLDGEHALVVLLALFTLAAAALAAFIQDDLRHAIGYLVIADGGLILLAFAALDPAAWGPARAWLVALAASKTALGAWGAVAEARFETRSLPDLRGWIRRAPILAAGFVLAALATYGLPGWIAFEARGDLARLAAGSPMDVLLVLAGFLTLPTYVRVLALGTGPASSPVARAAPERIVRARRPAETLVVQQEGPAAAVPAGADVEGEGRRDASDAARRTDEDVEPTPGAGRRQVAGRLTGSRNAAAGLGRRVGDAIRRDRTELLSAAVLALAILAALTSWGALDLGSAASEPAPIVAGPSSD
jgi:NADH:ubiquinone oxidoreductase subunit 2 (subunit N)